MPNIVVQRNQSLTDLHLPDPHGALDRGRWKQGRIGIDPDRKPAISHLRHIVRKGREILGVEIVSGIGGGKFPCDLRGSGCGCQY
jgi:hypothetical protein